MYPYWVNDLAEPLPYPAVARARAKTKPPKELAKKRPRPERSKKQLREFRPPDEKFVNRAADQIVFTAPKITSLTARHFLRATHEARRASLNGLTIDCQDVQWGEPAAMLQILAHTENLRNRGMHFDLLLPQDRSAARLFENAGWAHFLAPHLNDPPRFEVEHHLPTQRYVDASELSALRENVLEFAMRFLGSLRSDLLRAIEWSLDEITDNVLNHADSPHGGFLQVDAPKGSGFLQVIVADGGRGIPESMREGHPNLRYDQDAVGEAIKLGVTRSPEVGQGNGLAGALRVATFSGGIFQVRSYRSTVTARRSNAGQYNQKVRGTSPEESLQGTVVTMKIRTDTNFDVADALNVVNWVDDWGYLETQYGDDNVHLRLSDETSGLGSRGSGLQIRNKISTLLNTHPDKSVTLDWSGVPTISSSFADELVGRLFVELGPVIFNSRVQLVGMEPFVAALIDRAIRQRAVQGFTEPVG